MSDIILRDSWTPKESSKVLIKSKVRVKSYGEVFTPGWMVEKMLDELREETNSIYKTILEPSAGNGNFLVALLLRKLEALERNYAGEEKLWDVKALFALSSIYAIEIQLDNVSEARRAMLTAFANWLNLHNSKISPSEDVYKSAKTLVNTNIVWGDTLTQTHRYGGPIIMSEWKLAKPKSAQVERIPFVFASHLNKQPSSETPDHSINCQLTLSEPEPIKPLIYKIVNIKKIYKEETI